MNEATNVQNIQMAAKHHCEWEALSPWEIFAMQKAVEIMLPEMDLVLGPQLFVKLQRAQWMQFAEFCDHKPTQDGMMDKTTARFFYEQCAGVTSGHMLHIPNTPVIWSLLVAHTGGNGEYGANIPDFVQFLRDAADALDTKTP